jgi:chromosome segregation ATPase
MRNKPVITSLDFSGVSHMLRIGKLALILFFITIIWGGLFTYPATSQQLESRLNNLEFDFNRLESRLNQIELQIHQTSSKLPNIRRQSSQRGSVSPQERDKMFDRLATLVIELKQQVQALEKRVKKLESL